MKYKYKEYIIKVTTWGDSITPMYRYRLIQPRKWWFGSVLWIEDVHRNSVGNKVSNRFDWLIEQYEREVRRWEV